MNFEIGQTVRLKDCSAGDLVMLPGGVGIYKLFYNGAQIVCVHQKKSIEGSISYARWEKTNFCFGMASNMWVVKII